jgi:hypothetical protein
VPAERAALPRITRRHAAVANRHGAGWGILAPFALVATPSRTARLLLAPPVATSSSCPVPATHDACPWPASDSRVRLHGKVAPRAGVSSCGLTKAPVLHLPPGPRLCPATSPSNAAVTHFGCPHVSHGQPSAGVPRSSFYPLGICTVVVAQECSVRHSRMA